MVKLYFLRRLEKLLGSVLYPEISDIFYECERMKLATIEIKEDHQTEGQMQ